MCSDKDNSRTSFLGEVKSYPNKKKWAKVTQSILGSAGARCTLLLDFYFHVHQSRLIIESAG